MTYFLCYNQKSKKYFCLNDHTKIHDLHIHTLKQSYKRQFKPLFNLKLNEIFSFLTKNQPSRIFYKECKLSLLNSVIVVIVKKTKTISLESVTA